MTPYERILKQPCDKFVARALIEAGYYRTSFDNIRKWLWHEKGIMLTPPSRETNCYVVYIQYLTKDGKKEHSIHGEDGTPDGAFRDVCLTVLELLTMEPPRLYWWERIARRLGLLGKTEAERWYEEKVLPLKQSKPVARKSNNKKKD